MNSSEVRTLKTNAVIGSLFIFLVLSIAVNQFWQITTSVGWHITLGLAQFFFFVNLISDFQAQIIAENNGTGD